MILIFKKTYNGRCIRVGDYILLAFTSTLQTALVRVKDLRKNIRKKKRLEIRERAYCMKMSTGKK